MLVFYIPSIIANSSGIRDAASVGLASACMCVCVSWREANDNSSVACRPQLTVRTDASDSTLGEGGSLDYTVSW